MPKQRSRFSLKISAMKNSFKNILKDEKKMEWPLLFTTLDLLREETATRARFAAGDFSKE